MALHKSRTIISIAVILAAIALMAFQLSRFTLDASLRQWHTGAEGYKNALALQKSSLKPIALFFHTDWCSSCKKLRETVLASRKFDEYLRNVIPVKINPESGLKERQIADSYGVTGYPTFLLINFNGQKVARIRTSQNLTPEQFIEQCNAAQQS